MRVRQLAEWALLLLVFSLPLVRPFSIPRFGTVIPATDFIFIAVFVLTLIALLTRQLRIPRDPLYLFFILYAVAMTAATLISDDPTASKVKLLGEYYLIALAICTSFLFKKACLHKVSIAWISATVLSCAAVLAGVVLFAFGDTSPGNNYFMFKPGTLPFSAIPRMQGLLLNANMLCDYLNVSLAFALLSIAKNWIPKVIGLTVVILICLAAVFTFSPGLGGIFLTAGLWFYGMRYKSDSIKKLVLAVALGAALPIFAMTLVSPDTDNTDQDFRIPYTNVVVEPSVRVLVWQNSLQRLSGHVLFGRGVGANVAELPYTVLNGEGQFLTDAHNMWLNVLGQEGLIGLTAFGLLVVAIWRRARHAEANDDPTLWALFCAFAGAFVYHGLTGSFEDARHLWILIGLIATTGREQDDDDTIRVSQMESAQVLGQSV